MSNKTKKEKRKLKHFKIRKRVSGTSLRPRITIFKSNKNLYVQIIDDEKNITLASSSTKNLKLKNVNIETAKKVGKDIAKKAKDKKIKNLVFDRSGYIYHGKVKALADSIREEGIKI